jgi:DtxR family Mn-dependent transcriptional regulator
MRREKSLNKPLFHNTSENVEEYLEALMTFEERGKSIAEISRVAEQLGVKPPSVVEMLKKLEERGLVIYHPYKGVTLTTSGRVIARRVIRNHRLVELLMKQTLGVNVDESVACGIEHHMTEVFTNALCTVLKHPRKCPHGNRIPMGSCC